MRQYRSSGSAEGVMGNHDPYSDNTQFDTADLKGVQISLLL
jgi:hypothetical protein